LQSWALQITPHPTNSHHTHYTSLVTITQSHSSLLRWLVQWWWMLSRGPGYKVFCTLCYANTLVA